jgi:hypothetical protein
MLGIICTLKLNKFISKRENWPVKFLDLSNITPTVFPQKQRLVEVIFARSKNKYFFEKNLNPSIRNLERPLLKMSVEIIVRLSLNDYLKMNITTEFFGPLLRNSEIELEEIEFFFAPFRLFRLFIPIVKLNAETIITANFTHKSGNSQPWNNKLFFFVH